jgi:hypothetical protein
MSTSLVVSSFMVLWIIVVWLCVSPPFTAALLHLRSVSGRGHFMLQLVSQKASQLYVVEFKRAAALLEI